jgi:hypothetical protein
MMHISFTPGAPKPDTAFSMLVQLKLSHFYV